ncbi:hypothetical protein GF314_04030 [bacterium]|nr:hypothetical protein [bacterium]
MKRLLPILLVLVAACAREPDHLTLADLTADESFCLERLVVLERARAVALADPELGEVVLDSLAVAWGDSVPEDLLRRLPLEPRRASRFHGLLRRVLEAENDSLTFAPRRDRLDAPLPTPAPPG